MKKKRKKSKNTVDILYKNECVYECEYGFKKSNPFIKESWIHMKLEPKIFRYKKGSKKMPKRFKKLEDELRIIEVRKVSDAIF